MSKELFFNGIMFNWVITSILYCLLLSLYLCLMSFNNLKSSDVTKWGYRPTDNDKNSWNEKNMITFQRKMLSERKITTHIVAKVHKIRVVVTIVTYISHVLVKSRKSIQAYNCHWASNISPSSSSSFICQLRFYEDR